VAQDLKLTREREENSRREAIARKRREAEERTRIEAEEKVGRITIAPP
jgi:hypothetical protein